MSLAALALEKVQAQRPPLRLLAAAPGVTPAQGANPPGGGDNQKSVLEALTRYIPTEIVTLYVATLAAKPALRPTLEGWFGPGRLHAIGIYWGYVVLTPLFYLLVYVSGRFQHNQGRPALRQLPWWPMLAATLAFIAWGLSVPTNPVVSGNVAPAVAGLFSLFLSVVLTQLDPVFDPSKRDGGGAKSP